jgi:hypothetical protein
MMTVNMLAGRARVGRAVIATALAALLLPLLAVPGAMPARAGGICILEGSGDEEDPFEVEDHFDLAEVGVDDCGLDKHYRQTADITLPLPTPGGSNHTPIGAFGTAFTGTYDGGGFEIVGMVVEGGTTDYQGLFGLAIGATLTGIRLVDATVKGSFRLGALAGEVQATRIEDSSVSGASLVEGTGNDIGGLVGRVDSRSGADAIIRSSSSARVKGAVGSKDGSGNIGGLIGRIRSSSTITESSASGQVTGYRRIGGLVGQAEGGRIERSFATGAAEGTINVGGLVGELDGSGAVIDSYATGPVTGTSDTDPGSSGAEPTSWVGGLVGRTQSSASVATSYATGAIVAATGATDVGGLIGRALGSTSASFWDLDATGLSTSGGGADAVGRSTAQMKTLSTFSGAGWDISSSGVGTVWVLCGEVYPALAWTPAGEGIASSCRPASVVTSSGPSYVAPGGVVPSQTAGSGAWVQADGSSVPLAVSSPGVNQVRYAADGIEVTFTGGSGSSVSRGLVTDANGEVVCEICVALAAGQVVEVWMFSTPRLVAAHLIADLPCQRFSIPVVAPLDGGGPVAAGAHTLQLALPTASGMQAVNVGVTVGGPVPASVPAGEGSVPFGAVLFVLLGAAVVLVAGRRLVTAG